MKNVLIISRWFPPLNMIASKRFGTMCKYFEEYGYKPFVLTAVAQRVPVSGFSMDFEIPVNESQIIRIGQMGTNYLPQSLFFNMLVELQKKCGVYLNSICAASLGRYEKVRSNIDLDIFKHIDIIVATYPEMDSVFLAKYISSKLRIPYIVDYRDLIDFADDLPTSVTHVIPLDVVIEQIITKDAAALVPVTNGYKRILSKRYHHRIIRTIFNGWDFDNHNNSLNRNHITEKKYLYYAGTLYEHRIESLMTLVESLKVINKYESCRLIVRSAGPEKHEKLLKKAIKERGVEEYVKLLPAVQEAIVREEQESAYINIVLSTVHEDDTELMATIPGKVYELLTVNVPILAVVPKQSDVDRLLNYTNKGVGTTRREEMIDFILYGSKNYCGNKNIRKFSRKNQARKYCRLMDEILLNKGGQ